jgi:hypothetical protein
MNLARPFKAGKGLADEQCVALATLDSTVANATDFSCHKFVPALKGRAKLIWPLRGQLLIEAKSFQIAPPYSAVYLNTFLKYKT